MRYYILRKNDLYLSDIMTNENKLINFTLDNDYRKLYDDYELAEEDKKLIFIETGLNFEIEVFKNENK